MSKYDRLTSFLRESRQSRLPLGFAEVEEILGFALPSSARRHRPWWANQKAAGHAQARGWADAGWRTTSVNLADERVVFQRDHPETAEVGESAPRPFVHPVAGAPGRRAFAPVGVVSVRLDGLGAAARRLVEDYTNEAGGDPAAAIARAVHEAAVARRRRLVGDWVAHAPRMPPGEPDIVDLIREDRDAR